MKSKKEYKEVVNKSLALVMGRTILTTLTTLCPIIALMIFGSQSIFNFNFSLLIGLICGVYSSIFIACQIWYDLSKNKIGKIKKNKWYDDDEVEELKIKGINS